MDSRSDQVGVLLERFEDWFHAHRAGLEHQAAEQGPALEAIRRAMEVSFPAHAGRR